MSEPRKVSLDGDVIYYGDRGGDSGIPYTPSNGGQQISAALDISKITTTGGLIGTDQVVLMALRSTQLDLFSMGFFDFEDLNCEEVSEVKFRQEEILAGREVTVSRVRLVYRNLGKVEVEAIVETTQCSKNHKQFIGDDSPVLKGKVMTAYFDLIATGERPQLTIRRTANSGALAIIKAQMITDVELAEQV